MRIRTILLLAVGAVLGTFAGVAKAQSTVLLTEVAQDPATNGGEFVEVTNVTTIPVDITGWTLYFWDSNTTLLTGVAGSIVMQPGDTHLYSDVSSTPTPFTVTNTYLGANIGSMIDQGIVLTDAGGNIVDAAFFGAITPTSIQGAPFTVGAEWTGATNTNPVGNGPSQERNGNSDNNDTTDWAASTTTSVWSATDTDTMELVNPGLTIPFAPPTDSTLLSVTTLDESFATQPQSDVVVMDMSISTFIGDNDLNSITFTYNGTAPAAELTDVSLYIDVNTDGIIDVGDTVLGSSTIAAGTVQFSGTPLVAQTVATSPQRLLLGVDTTGNLTNLDTIEFDIVGAADISWTGGSDLTSFPVDGGVVAYDITTTIQLGVLGTGNNFPFNFSTGSGRFMSAYTPGEMSFPAGGFITEIRVFGSGGATPIYSDFRLRLGHTPASTNVAALSSTYANNVTPAGLTTVIGPISNYTPTSNGSWYIFPLSTPFVYNGTEGLVVDWSYSARSGTGWSISSSAGRSRVYTNGGNFQSTTGTSNAGNYGIEIDLLPLTDAAITGPGAVARLDAENAAGVTAAGFSVNSIHTSAQDMTDLTLTYTGTAAAASVTNVTLWEDPNGNGILDTGETQIAAPVASLTSNQATFTGSPILSAVGGGAEHFLVTCDVGAANPGETISFEISAETDVTYSPGSDFTTYPVSGGPGVEIVIYSSTLPFTEEFVGTTPNFGPNVRPDDTSTSFPTATGVGTPVSSANSTPGTFSVVSSFGGITPFSGTDFMLTPFASPQGVSALDLRFDLTAFNAASITNKLELSFAWFDNGVPAPGADDFNYVFLSDDGGVTWFRAAYDFDEGLNSGLWEQVFINLSQAFTAAGRSFTDRVVVRLQNAGASTADSAGFDLIELRDVPAALEISGDATGTGGVFANIIPANAPVLDLLLKPQVANQNVSSITVSNIGTVPDADITEVKLWLDLNDSGGIESGQDIQIGGTQQFTGGQATFGSLNMDVNLGTRRDLLITYTLAAGASGDVGCEVSAATDITNTPDPVVAIPGPFPIGGVIGTVAQPSATLPYDENFSSGSIPTNISIQTGGGTYPTASAVGGSVGSATTGNDAQVNVSGPFNGVGPLAGISMGLFTFQNGQATGAMDFLFDLSAFNAGTDQLEFSYAWYNDGLSGGANNEPFDHVFISADGGNTWLSSIAFNDPTGTQGAWLSASANVSAALLNAGANFTSNVVIRLQFAGTNAQNAMIDTIGLEVVSATAPIIGAPTEAVADTSDTVLITEAAGDPGTSGNEYIEVTNVSGGPVDITGWTMWYWETFGTTLSWLTGTTTGMVLQSGETHMYVDSTSTSPFTVPSTYLGANSQETQDIAAILVDASGNVVDAVFFGTTNPGNIGSTPFTIGSSDWSGPSVATNPLTGGPSQERVGSSDNNDASDWATCITPSVHAPAEFDTMELVNPGLTIPFGPTFPTLQVSGPAPNYTATIEQGGDLNFNVEAVDPNTGDTITWTITDLGTGSLSAAQAGFNETFTGGVYDDPNPNQVSPHKIGLTGIAAELGTVDLQIDATDSTANTSSITLSITVQAGSPIIRTSETELTTMNAYGIGSPSIEESFSVQGYGLLSDLDVEAPTGFEVSTTSGSGFASSLALTPTAGSVLPTDIFVRYNPGSAGPHSGDVKVSSQGLTSINVAVDGVLLPTIPSLQATPQVASNQPLPEAVYYTFDEGAGSTTQNLASPGQGASSGTFAQAPTRVAPGRVGDAHIEGPTSLDTGFTPTFAPNEPWTIEVLVKIDPTTNQKYIFAQGTAATHFRCFTGGLAGSGNFVLRGGGMSDLLITGGADGAWHQLAFVYDGAGTVSGYLDAALNNQITSQTPSFGSAPIEVGDADASGAFDGEFDEFRIWTSARQSSDLLNFIDTRIDFEDMGGTAPDFTADVFIGQSIDMVFNVKDFNTQETLTYTVTEGAGLTAAAAGLTQTFTGGVYNDPAPGRTPHSLELTGTAATVGTLDLIVEVFDGALSSSINVSVTILNPPVVTLGGTPIDVFLAPPSGGPSPERSFTVSGANLLGDVTVTAPSEFEVSLTSGGPFSGNVSITPTAGSIASTPVFVRYNPTSGASATGDLVISTVELADITEGLFGVVGFDPVISTVGTPLAEFFSPGVTTPSPEQQFTVLVANPVSAVTITAPAEFEVSLSQGSGYGPSVSAAPAPGAGQMSVIVFVRYNPTVTGPATGVLTIDTSGATSASVTVDGSIGSGGGGGGGGSGSGSGGGDDGGGGCVVDAHGSSTWVLLLGALAAMMIALRVRLSRAARPSSPKSSGSNGAVRE